MPAATTSSILPNAPCFAPVELASTSLPGPAARFSFADVPQLTRALRAGDSDAFRFLHAAWHHRILRYCFALAVGDDAFATEIAQAVYLRIFKAVPAVLDEGALWNWITCAIRSAAIDLRRVGGRYRRALGRFADWLRHGAMAADERAEEARLYAALDDALAALDVEDRQLIERRYFRREPLEAIAAQCDTTARAIEGRLARLRARLRTTMTTALRRELP